MDYFLKDGFVWMYRSMGSFYWQNLENIRRPYAIALANVCHLSATLILATLVTFISVPIVILKELNRRMDQIYRSHRNSPIILSLELEKWREHHDLACSLIENTNSCFGPCLLIYLAFAITSSVRIPSVTIKECYEKGDKIVIARNILGLTFIIIQFFGILYAAQTLKKEVLFGLFKR